MAPTYLNQVISATTLFPCSILPSMAFLFGSIGFYLSVACYFPSSSSWITNDCSYRSCRRWDHAGQNRAVQVTICTLCQHISAAYLLDDGWM
ncbi:hypothetical protein BO94DRAFT_310079 [Aspergillus sclerotioniger CBS 115572]|uniref:Uncharacterized protein n=1 Tax=Aspergillus sclerotioniger CBS 115572 TaxID=1450535 RepID=A0A317V507_9EURO|nr:hypothetical protein BO94DRAFT_310079 [Aspergillus sclerotioniger CBS 115572]PWY67280.1 hypothetical protein BO94DRAFT_310079 [Aspergillus sclerotioniger CBS 115572]